MRLHLPGEQLIPPLSGRRKIQQKEEKARKSRKSKDPRRAPENEETGQKGEQAQATSTQKKKEEVRMCIRPNCFMMYRQADGIDATMHTYK
jgi:hypothetical protein